MFDREYVVWTDRLVSMLSFDLCALSLKSSLDRFTVPTCDEISPVDVCFSYDISARYIGQTQHINTCLTYSMISFITFGCNYAEGRQYGSF